MKVPQQVKKEKKSFIRLGDWDVSAKQYFELSFFPLSMLAKKSKKKKKNLQFIPMTN